MAKKTTKRASKKTTRKPAKKTNRKPAKKAVKSKVKKTTKPVARKTTKKTTKKTTTAKKSKSCPKCGHTKFDKGEIKVGQVYNSHNFGYKSEKHFPYADHVSQRKAVVCLGCGYTEIYIDVEDLKRKVRR